MITVLLGEKKHEREYTVKPISASGEGSPISIILGDPTDSRGNKLYKTRSAPRVFGLSKMGNKAKYSDEESVAMAASTDPKRPAALHHVHIDNGTLVAADGFRLHTAPTSKKVCPICKKDDLQFPDYKQLFPDKFAFQATVNSTAIYNAFIRAGVFAREGSNVSKVRANGHIEVSAISEEYGQTSTDIEYISITGPMAEIEGEMTFGINWEYARDAIKHVCPNGGDVTIKAVRPHSPIVFEANGRTALVTPMQLR